jgi:prepilin-type N-terminal cleavage/methylation domain-containing protein
VSGRRRGFSFIELLVVLIFLGLLARLGIPRYSDMKRRATAAAILGDVHAIRVAAFTYYTEKQTWPPESGPGAVPSGLVDYLPANFSFTRVDREYDYEVWSLSTGTPGNPTQEYMIGVAVDLTDPELATRVLKTASRGYGPFAAGNKVTFFITGFAGN